MKILTIVGARPQFIKAAPVSRAIVNYNESVADPQSSIVEVLVHTGQHYDRAMSEVFFEELEIKRPDYNLGIGSGSHATQTGEMLKGIETTIQRESPDWMLVYGDTNSTLAGALAASKLQVPVAHVEAGLRSFNREMPEEINRLLTDHISRLLFCPTQTAVANLRAEGITEGVHEVGDVMYDALHHNLDIAQDRSDVVERLGLEPKGYYLVTVHRPANTDDPRSLGSIVEALRDLSVDFPIVWPVHPRTRKALESLGIGHDPMPRCQVVEPVCYLDMLKLEKGARVILTDSGGVQKEAYWLQVPCITLREDTEWLETVDSGWNTLVGSNRSRIVEAVRAAKSGLGSGSLCGCCNAAHRIVEVLLGTGPASD